MTVSVFSDIDHCTLDTCTAPTTPYQSFWATDHTSVSQHDTHGNARVRGSGAGRFFMGTHARARDIGETARC